MSNDFKKERKREMKSADKLGSRGAENTLE